MSDSGAKSDEKGGGVLRRIVWGIEAGLVLIVLVPTVLLPLRAVRWGGRWLGILLYGLLGSRRRIALRNTRLVFGQERVDLVRGCFQHLGMTVLEVLRVWAGREDVVDGVRLEGAEHYAMAKASGRPVIVITGHQGNWELIPHAASRQGILSALIARRLDNPHLNRFSERIRTRRGNPVIYKKGALKQTLRMLGSGVSVTILVDQGVRRPEGVVTGFLGRPALTTRMPALLALKTHAWVVPVGIRRTATGHVATICPPLPVVRTGDPEEDVARNTDLYTRAFESFVLEAPSEWLWIHNRWKRIAENEALP